MKETWVVRGIFAMTKDLVRITLTPLNKIIENKNVQEVAQEGMSAALKYIQQETMEVQSVIFISTNEFLNQQIGLGNMIELEAIKI